MKSPPNYLLRLTCRCPPANATYSPCATSRLKELQWIAEGRVVDGDPAMVEGELLGDQDEIEFRLGAGYLERWDSD